jgi:FixJ family two-component response regulator
VLVVDDDVSIRASLELLIQSAGWQPETFGSAQEFLASPRLLCPCCLVLDVLLPDLNGLDLQERIASDRIHIPIIFITGYGDVPTTVRAMKGGAVEFLTKPFRDDVLLSASAVRLRSRACRIGVARPAAFGGKVVLEEGRQGRCRGRLQRSQRSAGQRRSVSGWRMTHALTPGS